MAAARPQFRLSVLLMSAGRGARLSLHSKLRCLCGMAISNCLSTDKGLCPKRLFVFVFVFFKDYWHFLTIIFISLNVIPSATQPQNYLVPFYMNKSVSLTDVAGGGGGGGGDRSSLLNFAFNSVRYKTL